MSNGSFNMTLDIRGITSKKLDELLRVTYPREIEAAQISALNRVSTTIRAEAAREISSASKIKPISLIKGRMRRFKATKKRMVTGVYFVNRPMPAELLAGKKGIKWNRKMVGAKAGPFTHAGTFAGTPRAGRYANKQQRIYYRVSDTGDNRKDLQVKRLDLEKHSPLLKTVGQRVIDRNLEKLFLQQFEYRISKTKV
jgi:hypothetical protein